MTNDKNLENELKILIVAATDKDKPPVRPAYLKTWLERKESPLKNKAKTVLLIPQSDSLEKTKNEILLHNPDLIIFFTHIEWNTKYLFKTCKYLNKINPNITIAVTADSLNTLSERDAKNNKINLVFYGELQTNFENAAVNLLNRKTYYKNNTQFLRDSGTIQRLDDIPSPLLTKNLKIDNTDKVQVILSQGCNNTCTYCTINDIKERFFSKQRIQDEIKFIAKEKKDIKNILLMTSDMFNKNAVELLPFIKKIAKKHKIHFEFYSNAGVSRSLDLLKSADSPYFHIRIGLQTLNQISLMSINRSSDTTEIKRNIENMIDNMPHSDIIIELIFGLPFENEISFLESLEWCIGTGKNIIINRLFVPPQSRLSECNYIKDFLISDKPPYYVLASNAINKATFNKLNKRIKNIFAVLNMINSDLSVKKNFFNTAKTLKGKSSKTPLVFLAEKFYLFIKKHSDIFSVCENYKKSQNENSNYFTGNESFFSSRDKAMIKRYFHLFADE